MRTRAGNNLLYVGDLQQGVIRFDVDVNDKADHLAIPHTP
jgi:hypothetical protein